MAALAFLLSRRNREQSIGVSVNDTHSDTMIATAIVIPKLRMNRPAIPDMNATGRKMTTSENVVAITAMPISLVAPRAASQAGRPFSSIQRKIFS